ncbi:MAG: hypothetical protein JRH10_13175 [Deltaproteobacteria bacterium]|nr:hypothetical protein [Deltaproteobacteria bacterium]MBW2446101.1 hypothetical protein [Deltaproteobacteria bacterium]
MKRWLRRVLLASTAIVLALGAWIGHNVRDRHPGYALDLAVDAGPPAPLEAGFAARSITPTVPDRWVDHDGDARRGNDEPWEDGNANGRFDPVWLAGFHNGRPARDVHDELWARAVVLGDGRHRVALVVLDAIGFYHDAVVDVRQRVPAAAGIDHVIVASTHTHQAPDLMGLWGPSPGRTGVDPDYLEHVVATAAAAVTEAASAAQPASLRVVRVTDGPEALVEDSRKPHVLDPDLRVLQARDATGQTLGTLVAWANHPETTWDENTRVSSDFPHFVREAIEAELGGTAIYVNGAIGGLMTTRPRFAIHDPDTGEALLEPTFRKARAQGEQLARLALQGLRRPTQHDEPGDGEALGPVELHTGALAIRARTLELPLENRIFVLAAAIGTLPRGFTRWATVRTEVSAFTLGPMSFISIPGELYPEILNGGIESPEGADHGVEPVELPPLRQRMPGRFRFALGLAGDALGYIIPKSEWDDEAPWLYGSNRETYGEVVSVGPNTAPTLHGALLELLDELATEPKEPQPEAR